MVTRFVLIVFVGDAFDIDGVFVFSKMRRQIHHVVQISDVYLQLVRLLHVRHLRLTVHHCFFLNVAAGYACVQLSGGCSRRLAYLRRLLFRSLLQSFFR